MKQDKMEYAQEDCRSAIAAINAERDRAAALSQSKDGLAHSYNLGIVGGLSFALGALKTLARTLGIYSKED